MAVMLVTVLNSTWRHAPDLLHDTEPPLLFAEQFVSVLLAFRAESGIMERFCSPSGELHSIATEKTNLKLI